MTIQLTCPYCRFTKDLPESAIPATAKRAICPQCGQQFLFSPTRTEALPAEAPPGGVANSSPAEPPPDGGESVTQVTVPWESIEASGFWARFFRTTKEVLFSSETFFQAKRHPPESDKSEPLAFGLLTGTLGFMASFFWQTLLMLAGFASFGGIFSGRLTYSLVFFILLVAIPAGVLLFMFFYSCLLHLLMRIVGVGRGRFRGTFRVVAYSQAVQLVAFVPLVGGWVANIWQLIVQVIGLRTIHETNYGRVILAFLIPLLVCLLLGVLAVLLVPVLLLRTS